MMNTLTGEIARVLLPAREAFIDDVMVSIEQTIGALGLTSDLADLLRASTTENVIMVMQVLANGVDPASVDAPASALVYARRLAREGVPLTALLRAYGLGQSKLLAAAIGEVWRIGMPDAAVISARLAEFAALYIDRVCTQVGEAYEREREHWDNSQHTTSQRWIERLLHDADPDLHAAEQALGYPLDSIHLAVEAWVCPTTTPAVASRALERTVPLLRHLLGVTRDPLLLPSGYRELRVWVPLSAADAPDIEQLRKAWVHEGVPVRLALGGPYAGAAGFRRTTAKAARTKKVAVSAGKAAPSVLSFMEVAPVALLLDEPEELADFTARTLGPLARDDARMEIFRETLRVFLAEDRSYANTAKKLMVHRNTVQYRIQQITGKFGLTLTGDTLDLRLALTICRWYRDRVLW
ncbi:PucR family transcriptional regulator [Nocardia arthritidis]|uniref:PucR family transcriptional regulator n=1 Tax=Nocardia arthritidis TaxID=228602 RepID=A0A6G9YL51_9NOCA|nr:helix-turn-helix domain-containing protein [Nocardia arthritidis]QIS13999.1 hypothetical protein F5544_30780 [Nocardia arthritidis]